MKRVLIIILTLSFFTVSAQSVAEVKSFDKEYRYELYRPYPVENIDSKLTAAPKGYKPFYISHLSRHGSRWHSYASSYQDPLAILSKADKAGELTELGKRLYKDVQTLAKDAENRYGELSAIGFEQHRGIANRMVKNYPQIFHKNCHIECRSTIVPRCILSMASAVQEITRLVPTADIRMESSENNTYLKAYAGLNSIKQDAKPLSDSLQSVYLPNPEPFLSRIFKKSQNIDSKKFMLQTFMLGAILGSTPVCGIDNIDYPFTEEEIVAIWRASNLRRYALTGPSKPFGKVIVSGVHPFVKHVITTADRAIKEGNEQATLHFAHDVTVIPFTAILGIKCGDTVSDDWEEVSYKWRINEVTPMGANIQLIFYRSNKSDDILVKILHNEREQIIDSSVATPVESVYYRWNDIRSYLLTQIQ